MIPVKFHNISCRLVLGRICLCLDVILESLNLGTSLGSDKSWYVIFRK